jgi:hypothetical protein
VENSLIPFLISVYQGFFLYSFFALIYAIVVNKYGRILFPRFDKAVVVVVRITGILFLLIIAGQTIIALLGRDGTEKYALLNRLFGPFWFAWWISFVVYGLLPQLLWMDKVRSSFGFRFLLSVLIVIASFLEKIVIIALSNPDFIPICWTFDSSVILVWLKELLIFCLFAYLVYIIHKRLQQNQGENETE